VTQPGEQPTLSDGTITLRPWRDEDVDEAVAGHDAEMALWFGWDLESMTTERHRRAIADGRADYANGRRRVSFAVEHEGRLVGSVEVTRRSSWEGDLSWTLYAGHRGHGYAARAVRILVDWSFADPAQGGLGLTRVEARVDPRNERSRRVATRAGLHQEGLQRVMPGSADRADATSVIVYARLASDPPLSDPQGFRSLLNSFLPRKRAISQMLIRDQDDRVLLCQLTYKTDWDLPGGVVEVGESPRLAVSREVEEELGLTITAGDLLLTDWLPPWGGWDDAICLVFDGGVHDPAIVEHIVKQEREIRDAQFCSPAQVRQRATDFTARRIETAIAGGAAYTESGS
jgi:RimJ/RimL family protein N-acetyltransferase/8-oxo-dGTP pyrophosphatase MutT (NUDIX family)